ncbi:MAG: hypothetical protein KDK05_32535, partial [Candidatus Competibacteraceae bacterium]|nr:hypothetical protein [Candidatus Competibacteraceae bacterium]
IVIADSTKIEIQPDTMVVLCQAEEVCLTATAPAAECIVWTTPAGDTLGLGAELCIIPEVGLNTYIASIPGLDCIIPDTAYVKLVPDSVMVSVSPDPLKLCVGDTACLTASVSPSDLMASLRWFDLSGMEVGTGSELCVSHDAPGEYQYIAMVDNGCSMDSDTATVIVIADSTKIEIVPDSVVLCQPEEVCLR